MTAVDWGNATAYGMCPHGWSLGSGCLACVGSDFVQQGWECPKCGHVFSPSVAVCMYCPQKAAVTTGTGIATGCTCGTSIPCTFHPGTRITTG